jgi:transposase-like protein
MDPSNPTTFGSNGGTVEVDETFIGVDKTKAKGKGGFQHKNKVLSLVDRKSGSARSIVVKHLEAKTVVPILRANIAAEARVMTDDAGYYTPLALSFAEHKFVNHSAGEYVSRTDPTVHTNTIEGFFSIFKRGMTGVYQHCGQDHLHRYLAEFDFRYSERAKLGVNDAQRADKLLKGVTGKRLMYQTPSA